MWSLIKRDLGEFVTTLKDDVAIVRSAISLGGEGGEDGYESYESDDSDSLAAGDMPLKGRSGGGKNPPVSAAFRALRADVKTYSEPVSEAEADSYATFMRAFDLGGKTQEIATVLKDDPVVAKIHTHLVPEHLSYDDFWSRFFFRSETVGKGRAGGISFPRDDEEDDDFGWGEDDQDDEDTPSNPAAATSTTIAQSRADTHNTPDLFEGAPAAVAVASGRGGAEVAGARGPQQQQQQQPQSQQGSLTSAGGGGGGVVKSLASAAAAAEITRLTEALQRSEAEREALIAGGSDVVRRGERRGSEGDGRMERVLDVDEAEAAVQRMTRERDAAMTEVDNLFARLRQAEADRDQAVAVAAQAKSAPPATAPAVGGNADAPSSGRLDELQQMLRASEARAAKAEKELEVESAARGKADESFAAATAAAAAAKKEILRLKKALREQRAEHESALLASRQAANEAVEEAMSSADADREEACAEVAAQMAAEATRKDEMIEALRSQLAVIIEANEKWAPLQAEVAELRQALESEREASMAAARDARQEKDAAKQLSEELRIFRAAADRPRSSPARGAAAAAAAGEALNRVNVSGSDAPRRGNNTARSDVGEDTDDWGDEGEAGEVKEVEEEAGYESDSCCADSTNSSGVVVDHPPASSSANEDERDDSVDSGRGAAAAQLTSIVSSSDSSSFPSLAVGRAAAAVATAVSGERGGDEENERRRDGGGAGGDAGDRGGEGDDGWEGWD